MKVLLIYLPHGFKPDLAVSFYGFPTGVAYIAGALRDGGHSVYILDLHLNIWTGEVLSKRLKQFISQVDVVCMGGMITTFPAIQMIADELKAMRPEVPIIVGGSSATSSPEIIMNHSKADYCVLGEGEETIKELMDYIENKGNMREVKGIAFREEDEVVINESRPRIDDLDASNWPAYDILRADEYVHRTGVWRNMVMHTSRGCPNNCRYCYRIFGHKVRYRTVESMMEEIRYLHEHFGVHTITFEDDDFPRHRKRLEQFCEALARSGMKSKCKTFATFELFISHLLVRRFSFLCMNSHKITIFYLDDVFHDVDQVRVSSHDIRTY